jgi:NitT/TauT family transport system substrate-binding protein
MNRRLALRISTKARGGTQKAVAVLLSLLVLAACGGGSDGGDPAAGSEKGPEKLRVAVTDTILPFYYPWGVAQTQGFWADEGLEVEILPGSDGSSAMMQQLIGGQADVAHPGPTVVFNAAEEGYGDDMSVFGTWLYRQGFELKVPEGSPITSADQLKGKTIGISEASGGEVPILKATLLDHGLEEGKDYKLLPIGGGEPQTVQAIKDGDVDAYCTANKDFIGMQQTGLSFTDITFPEWSKLTANVFVASPKLVKSNPAILEKYLRGLVKALIFTHKHPKEALQSMKTEFPEAYVDMDDSFSLEWIELTEKRMYLPELVSDKSLFTVDRDGIESYLSFLQGVGDVPADLDLDIDQLLNEEIAQKANDFDFDTVDAG